MKRQPRSIAEAVERLVQELPGDTLDFIRGMPAPEDLSVLHFGLGMHIRNSFNLWSGNTALLIDCGFSVDDGHAADAASGEILNALRRRLIESASPEDRARGDRRWQQYEQERYAVLERQAARDALITARRCSHCGRPCPRYRLTCKYCDHLMGREVVR